MKMGGKKEKDTLSKQAVIAKRKKKKQERLPTHWIII